MNLTLPIDSNERKEYPMFRGLLAYFPAALAGVARHSKRSNDKHNPGEEMHHARGKSTDHADCIIRHLADLGDMLARIERNGGPVGHFVTIQPLLAEADALAWRALALSQDLYERFDSAPLAPNAREPERMTATETVKRLGAQAGATLLDPFYPTIVGYEPPSAAEQKARELQQRARFEGWPSPRCVVCQQNPCACGEFYC